MQKTNVKFIKLTPDLHDTIRRMDDALADIDGLTLGERYEGVRRGIIGQRDLAIWKMLADVRDANSAGGFSESKKLALATMLVMFMGDKRPLRRRR